MKKSLLLLFCFSFNILLLQAQKSHLYIYRADSVHLPFQLDTTWKFHSGDDPSWAQKEFNDSLWEEKNTQLFVEGDDKNKFSTIGWFRIHLSIAENLQHHPVALIIGQYGASEIYIDGKLIRSFGQPAAEKSKEVKYSPVGAPVIFEFGEGESHVIAVRYSVHLSPELIESPGNLMAGFILTIKESQAAVEEKLLQSKVLGIFSIFLCTFYFTLGFVHFLLFLFYRKQKSNLFYSIFIADFGLFFLFPFLSTNSTNPETQIFFSNLLSFNIPLFFVALLGFLYSLFHNSTPKKLWIFSSVIVFILILNVLKVSYTGFILFGFTCMITIVCLVEVIISIFKKRKGAWVVGTATISFLFLILFLLIKNALGYGSGVHVNTFDFKGMMILGIILLAILSIPFSMSVYLAKEFAGTNKNLEKKLVEVEDLSAKSIEQEKEKQKILATQNEMLEVQVEERTHEISEQKKIIEEKNKDITDSINYAKTIQEAILPDKEIKYRIFPDAFVLFKPKDIVSGDFYWFSEKDGKRIIAACDCTGHGVPGALMSMIGNNILNQIVNEKGITSAGEILNLLHNEIHKSLKQGDQRNAKDGMDVAIVSFKNETEIEYAGAQRPLWIIKNLGSKEGIADSVVEIKGDKFSIGGSESEEERKFTNHKLSLSKGDQIYLFSDGYADQFSGDNKKLMTKRFKEILLSIQDKKMPEQEKFLDDFVEKWKGDFEQTDDILVIGIRA